MSGVILTGQGPIAANYCQPVSVSDSTHRHQALGVGVHSKLICHAQSLTVLLCALTSESDTR